MTKAIIFDCFGVLTIDHWKEFVATLSLEDSEIARGLIYEYDSGRIDTKELIAATTQLASKNSYEIEDIEKFLYDKEAKNGKLLSYIKQLKESYKVGLLSNVGTNWIRETFLSEEEQGMFDEIVLSYEVGLAKPDPAIFELVAEKLGLSPADCLLVDDSTGHCTAAARLGIKTIVYENFQQMKQELETATAS
jgi:epoxide hydrolase-like predicted phosphatase